MRICITRSSRYAYSETFIRDQIRGFSELAEVVTIHSGRFPEKKGDDTLIATKIFWLLHKTVKIFWGRNNFFSNYAMANYLKREKVEVVLANYGISAAHMVPVCKKLDLPLLVIFHGHDATNRKTLRIYKKKYERLFRYASFVIPVSEEMKCNLIQMGADSTKIEVVPCGVDVTKFKPEEERRGNKNCNFLAVGRFTLKKGPQHTIRSFYKVHQEFPQATLTMVGGMQGEYEVCKKLVSALGIEKSVKFTGILSQEEIAKCMSDSLAFVQHSITAPNGDKEGTPVSIMEASASGLPVVSTLHGGIKEAVIHDKTGFLVEEKDEQAMAAYMLKLCKNPELAREMGKQGRLHIEKNYEQNKQIRKLYELAKKSIALKIL